MERVRFSSIPGDTLNVYIRLQRVDYHLPEFDLHLTPTDYLLGEKTLQKKRTDWFFFGFLVAIVIFSFFLFLSTNDLAFLYHSLFLLSAMVFLLDMMGITPDMIWLRDHPKWAIYLNYLSQACWDVFFLQFLRSYMFLENRMPRWDNLFKKLIWLRILYFIGCLLG